MRNSADKAVTPWKQLSARPRRAWALKTPRSQAWPWFPHHRILCGLRLLKSTPRPPALHPFPELAGRQKGAMPKAACADACVFIYVISHSRDHNLTVRPSLPFPTGSNSMRRQLSAQNGMSGPRAVSGSSHVLLGRPRSRKPGFEHHRFAVGGQSLDKTVTEKV